MLRAKLTHNASFALIEICLVSLLLSVAGVSAQAATPLFHRWAQHPPMGWNSWDNFATTITEAQAKEQADYMAAHLKSFGWQYLVVDIQWYEPQANSHNYRDNAVLVMDDYGRLLPAPNRFPSAANGAGFKTLSDYAHKRGLKFGIHLMRGIPRQAVDKNLPIKGTSLHAQDVADRNSICPWNPDMYGVDMSRQGAQAYYNSVFELIASWGVDYVKVDDIARPYHREEIEAIRKAIDRTGRPMVLSLSPGETALSAAENVQLNANLWRISDDFWDAWPALHQQFARLERWNPYRGPGHWPDADMLPFGTIELGARTTHFTQDEHYTVMTLWSIARSPLMYGGDMTKMDAFTLSMLTNPEVIAVNQDSRNNRPLFSKDNFIAWVADVPRSKDKYLALFNARSQIPLDAERAVYRGDLLKPGGTTSTQPLEIDVRGAARVVMAIDDGGDGDSSDHGIWVEPRWVDVQGRETKVTDKPWVSAYGGWGRVSLDKAPSGKPMSVGGKPVSYGIGAQALSAVEYEVPAGAVQLRVTGALDDAILGRKSGGTLRFQIYIARTGGALDVSSLKVPVSLAELGLNNGAKVRDLWTRKDLGESRGEFAPSIPWHGAGLYRLSPLPAMK